MSGTKDTKLYISGKGKKFAIVKSDFNEFITGKLLAGALNALTEHEVNEKDINIFTVPGAFEIPLVVKKTAQTGKYDAIICLGAVIRGETPHFEYVSLAAANGVLRASLDTGIPCSFGVLTTDNVEQARDRAGGKAGNKGADAAITAIEMVKICSKIK